MLITLKTENLLKGLNLVAATIKTDPNLPILSHVLLETRSGRLRLCTTDLDTGTNTFVRAKIDEEGSLAVPVKTWLNYLNTVKAEELILKTDGNRLMITSDDGQAKINCLAGADFPFQYSLIKKIKTNFLLGLQGTSLKAGILRTAFSSAKDNSRPELAGILVWLKAKDLILAGTDSYRLAENLLRVDKVGNEEVKMIMPSASSLGLARILTDEPTQVFYSDNQILFEFVDHIFTARLTEGNYPDYKQIIPTSLATELVVAKQELALAVKRAGIFVGSMSNAIKLTFDDKSQKIYIKSEGGNLGSSASIIKADSFKGPAQEAAYNFQYLLDGINNIAGDKVVLATSGPDKPTVLRGLNDDKFTYLVMPVRS